MDKQGLFRIGDVARLFNLSVGTLRHYEKRGLLQPETIDPATGYRYYSARQFEALNTIRYLRVLGTPLPQIADFLKNRNVGRMQELLLRQKQERGLQAAGFSREITMIDYGLTSDTEQFVTEIQIPVCR